MRTRSLCHALVTIACLLAFATITKADEASGIVTNTSFGAFQLDEHGTVRQFNLSRSKTIYSPDSWFPQAGDKVKVTFIVSTGSKPVLEVQKAELIKSGPDSIPPMTSPITVEIVDPGRSGWQCKLPTGQIVKFESSRKTELLPVGVVLAIGQKVKVSFHVEKAFTFGINYVADKLEKVDK